MILADRRCRELVFGSAGGGGRMSPRTLDQAITVIQIREAPRLRLPLKALPGFHQSLFKNTAILR
jgi:hypothetical protein